MLLDFLLIDCAPLMNVLDALSIAYGVIAGILSYMLLNGIPFILMKISGGKIVPPEYENAEPWVIPPGGIVPRWVYVLLLHFPASFLSFPISLSTLPASTLIWRTTSFRVGRKQLSSRTNISAVHLMRPKTSQSRTILAQAAVSTRRRLQVPFPHLRHPQLKTRLSEN